MSSALALPEVARAARRRTTIRLWLPLTPVWVLLAPFALIGAPIVALTPWGRGIAPFRAAFAIGRMLFALSGTLVLVDTPDARVHVHIF